MRKQSFFLIAFIAGILLFSMNARAQMIDAKSPQEIRNYIYSKKINLEEMPAYSVTPSTSQPYTTGNLSQGSLNSALNTLNAVRYIAGLPEVSLDTDLCQKAQTTSLINAVNNYQSHYPSKPQGMDEAMYKLGFDAASQSNLAHTGNGLNYDIVFGWMADNGANNLSSVGHRKWCLSSRMRKTGFGLVNDYATMYALDMSGTKNGRYVAWPAQNMPLEFFYEVDNMLPWSLTVGKTVNASGVSVTLTRRNDGKILHFSATSMADGYFNVDNSYKGDQGCIIFQPHLLYSAGDSFHVSISGVDSSPIEYDVSFFSVSDCLVYNTEINLNKDNASIDVGKTIKLSAKVKPDKTKIAWMSSDTSIATVNNGTVKGISEGETDIVAYAPNGVKAVCRVTVTDPSITKNIKILKSYKPKIKKKSASKKSIILTVEKPSIKNVQFEVQYKKGSGKWVSIISKKNKIKIKKLKAGKKYKIRVRVYKKYRDNNQYSKWSKTISFLRIQQ
ncbi:CAP domain-containing protein [Butyrivibrio sp. JL13D10]|uniref:CAP domain-containing protein n=1 Tax=Butyrivibrio sp. JL13D10 TaxID=3236815 RepID=UPI0038B5F23E